MAGIIILNKVTTKEVPTVITIMVVLIAIIITALIKNITWVSMIVVIIIILFGTTTMAVMIANMMVAKWIEIIMVLLSKGDEEVGVDHGIAGVTSPTKVVAVIVVMVLWNISLLRVDM